MREILFRAWLKRTNMMVHVHSIHLNTKKVIVGDEFGNHSEKFEDIELMQFTGLTDKNGKKIFEGDIVKFNRTNALGWGTQRIGEVRYYDQLPIFYIFATTGDGWDWCECDNIEVIGNIHDNPELMKKDNFEMLDQFDLEDEEEENEID